MRSADEFDITIRRTKDKFIVGIQQLKLYVREDNIDDALKRLEDQKLALLVQLKAAGLTENFQAVSVNALRWLYWSPATKSIVGSLVAVCAVALLAMLGLGLFPRAIGPTITQAPELPNGRIVTMSSHIKGEAVTARINDDSTVISGWAIDSTDNGPVDQVVVFANGVRVGGSKPRVDPPETRRSYGDGRIVPNWFNVRVLSSQVAAIDAVQVFAETKSGWSELAYGKKYPFSRKAPIVAQIALLKQEISSFRAALPIVAGKDGASPRILRTDYTSFGTTSAIIPTIIGLADPSSGASILRPSFKPESPGTRFAVHVRINALLSENNEFVVAIFQRMTTEPVLLATRPAKADERVFVEKVFNIEATSMDPIILEVRVGIGRPGGTAYINGGPNGIDSTMGPSFIEIRQIK